MQHWISRKIKTETLWTISIVLAAGSLIAITPKNLLNSSTQSSFWLQISILSGFCYICEQAAKKIRIPDIVVIIIIAILLGPEYRWGILSFQGDILAWVAVIYKVFSNGVSVNINKVVANWRTVTLCGLLSFFVPFTFILCVGYIHSLGLFKAINIFSASYYTFDFFLVCALAFAAAPLALVDNILDAAHIRRTPYGTKVSSYQTFNEVLTWLVFAVIVSHFNGESFAVLPAIENGFSILVLTGVIIFLSYNYGDNISAFLRANSVSSTQIMALIILITLFAAAISDENFHGGIVIALLLGVFTGSIPFAAEVMRLSAGGFVKYVCLPIFFYQAFVDVNIFESFSLDVFLWVLLGGTIPGYLGILLVAPLSRMSFRRAHRLAISNVAIGISPLIVVKYLMPAHAPGKNELLAALALAIPLVALLTTLYLKIIFGLRRKTNLKLSFERGGLTVIEQNMFSLSDNVVFDLSDEVTRLFRRHTLEEPLSKNDPLLLDSVLQAAKRIPIGLDRKASLVPLPLPTTEGHLELYIYMNRSGPLDLLGEKVQIAIILAYPADNKDVAKTFNGSFKLFKNTLAQDNGVILKRISSAKHQSNPKEAIATILDAVDATISFS